MPAGNRPTRTPPLPGAGSHASSVTPGAVGTGQVPPRLVAQLLALSGERDQWERLAVAWARSSYRRGYQNGYDAGYRAGFEEAVLDWKITAAGLTGLGGPSYAELDRRRYPPDGRLAQLARRPGDFQGRGGAS